MIYIDGEQLERVLLLLNQVPRGAERALSGAINRGLQSARTAASREIRETYYIRQTDLYSGGGMQIQQANPSNVIGELLFAGSVIPLIRFNAKPRNTRRDRVEVAVLKKGGTKSLRHAYIADLGRYGEGVFERESSLRESSKELYGPSVAHMADNPKVRLEMQDAANETVANRIEQEIFRLLEGYGGLL